MLFRVVIDLFVGTRTIYIRASNWEQAVKKAAAALEKERKEYSNPKELKMMSITYLADELK